MKNTKNQQPGQPRLNHYERLIRQATGAAVEVLPFMERIMREDIFHSTLDWQSRQQLVQAAREAHALLNEDWGLFDLDQACRLAMFHQMKATSALAQDVPPGNRAALEAAESKYESAKAQLLTYCARMDQTLEP